MAIVGKCPLQGSGRCRELVVVGKCPLQGSGHYREVAVAGKCPLLERSVVLSYSLLVIL